jgi:uncharacterized protein YbaR (Trm112 family)
MQEHLDILCCPETRQPFQIADANLLADLNQKIKAGQVRNRAGKPVNELMDSGLLRQDRKFLYPVHKSIPVLLVDEAIPL